MKYIFGKMWPAALAWILSLIYTVVYCITYNAWFKPLPYGMCIMIGCILITLLNFAAEQMRKNS